MVACFFFCSSPAAWQEKRSVRWEPGRPLIAVDFGSQGCLGGWLSFSDLLRAGARNQQKHRRPQFFFYSRCTHVFCFLWGSIDGRRVLPRTIKNMPDRYLIIDWCCCYFMLLLVFMLLLLFFFYRLSFFFVDNECSNVLP